MYQPINWQNSPSVATPINAENLKHMEDGIKQVEVKLTTQKANVINGEAEPLTVNGFPAAGGLLDIIDGDSTNPTTRGMESTLHVQRVDRSELVDYATDIIPTVYVQTKRKLGGKAWLHGLLSAIEDESMTNPQTVAVAGMAYAVGNASIWGIYGDAVTYNPDATITGGEFDASNMGADHPYNYSNPKTMPFACGVWITAAGDYKCSFGLGIGGNFDCGISLLSGETFGIDIQSQPETLINFKNGANYETGGIGLNTGAFAKYGTGQDQGAIHLWKHRFCFGFGGGYFAVNNEETLLEFWYNGQRRGYIDLTGSDHAL